MNSKVKIIVFVIALVLIVFGADRILKMQNNISEQEKDDLNVESNIENEDVGVDAHIDLQSDKQEDSTVLEITSENFEEEVINSDKTVLIDFYATWCGPCQILSPIVEEFASENEDIKVVKLNVDNEYEIAGKYGVISYPTLIVIESGEVKSRAVGVISKENISKMVFDN